MSRLPLAAGTKQEGGKNMEKLNVKITQLPLGRFFEFVGFELSDEMGTKLSTELFCEGHCSSVKVRIEHDMVAIATQEPDYDVFIREALEKVLDVEIHLELCT